MLLTDLACHCPMCSWGYEVRRSGASETEGSRWYRQVAKMSCSALLDANQYRAKRPAIQLGARYSLMKGLRRRLGDGTLINWL